jgi:hypothetical protein
MGVSAQLCKDERMGAVSLFSLVPDRQAVAIPVEDFDAVATAIDKQEQVTGSQILGKGSDHKTRERIGAFTEIGRRSVEENPDGMKEPQHLEPPESVRAPMTTRTRRQAKRAFAVVMGRRTLFGKSASIGSFSLDARSSRCTVTGRKAGGVGR